MVPLVCAAVFILIQSLRSHSFPFQEAIFRVVASVLHLGNLQFAKGKEIDSSVLKDDKSKFHLQTVAELLMYVLGFQILLLSLNLFFVDESLM